MAVNIKAKYKSTPNQPIGPFVATLQYFDSSGFTFDPGSSDQLLSTTGGTSTGLVETLNIGPVYTTLKTNLTHQQLINGYTFNQIKCGDTYIVFQSTDVCYSSYHFFIIFIPVHFLGKKNDEIYIVGTLIARYSKQK